MEENYLKFPKKITKNCKIWVTCFVISFLFSCSCDSLSPLILTAVSVELTDTDQAFTSIPQGLCPG